MKRLKIQIFLLVFLILTTVTASTLFVYNFQTYNQQKKSVERSLNQTMNIGVNNFGIKIDMPDSQRDRKDDFDNVRFMDTTVYSVFLKSDNSVNFIINHSNSPVSEELVKSLTQKFIAEGESKKIGNLFTNQYSYKYVSGRYITIVDNTAANEFLKETLLITLLLFVLLEILFAMLSNNISNRIAKPVEKSFEQQKQFIADASHELKTPLSVIMASADALESNPAEHKWLENIKSESERMNKLIADLLELAKSDFVDDSAQFAIGNLSKITEKSILAFEGVMFENGVLLNDSIEEGIMLNMNEAKIQQLIAILLDNAVKHSQSAGTVEVVLKREKDIILTVTNQGEGIPKGEEEKIFERFYRADESRNRNENRYGLGLAIAKNICLNHNAKISAKSENGKTTFTVLFKV